MDAKYGSILRKTYFHALVWLYAVRALLYILTLGQAVPKLAAPAVDLRQPPFGSPTHKNLNEGKYNDYYQSERLLPLVLNQ